MKSKRRIVLGIFASIGIALAGAPAFGHDGGKEVCEPGMMGKGMSPADRAHFMENRLAKLKAELKITPDQEQAWKSFVDQVKKQAESMNGVRQAMQSNPPSASARDQMREGMRQRMAGLIKQLAAALTPEQKAVLDRHFEQEHG